MESKSSETYYNVVRTPATNNLGKSHRVVSLALPENNVSVRQQIASSGINLANISFDILPDSNTVLGSDIKILFKDLTFTVTGVATVADKPALYAAMKNKIGFSSNWLWQNCSTLDISINGQSMSRECSKYIAAYNQYIKTSESKSLSTYAIKPDYLQYQDHSVTEGSYLNSLLYEQDPSSDAASRSAFFTVDDAKSSITTPNVSSAYTYVIKASQLCAIPMSLFTAGRSSTGFSNVKSFSLRMSLNPNYFLNCFKAFGSSITVTGVVADIPSAPQLVYKIISPHSSLISSLVDVNTGLSKPTVYSLVNPVYRSAFNPVAVASKATANMVSTAINLDSVPSYIMVYCSREKYVSGDSVQKTLARTTCGGLIESLNLTWNNRLYTWSSPEALYDISAKNNLQLHYGNAVKNSGFAVLLNTAEDLGCADLFVSQSYNTSMNVTATVRNLSDETENLKLDVVCISQGSLLISNEGTELKNSFNLTAADNANLSASVSSKDEPAHLFIGAGLGGNGDSDDAFYRGSGFFGDLWSGIKSGVSSIWNNVAKPVISAVAPQALRTAVSVGAPLVEKLVSGNGIGGATQEMVYRSGGEVHHPKEMKRSVKSRKGGAAAIEPYRNVA